MKKFKDAFTANNLTQYSDLQQLVGFTSNFLQSFKVRFEEFRQRTSLFKFITHQHESGVSIRNFELEVADLKVLDVWVNKFKSLNEHLEILARQQAKLAVKHKWTEMKNSSPKTS